MQAVPATSPSNPTVKQGELYWCEPEPADIVGSEQKGDRIWLIVSHPQTHRGKCVVALPLSRHTEKACAHLIQVPKAEITMQDGNMPEDRVALTDQIRALDKTRLRKKAGFISRAALDAILDLGMDYLFGKELLPKS